MGGAGLLPQAHHLRALLRADHITLAWITGWLRLADRTRWLLLGPLALANTYEVVWVSTQRWRGVASHFNQDTTLDYALFLLGAAAIAVTVTVIVALTVLAFSAMQAPPSMALAIRAGLGTCWSPKGSAAG
jgi:multidrug transporter EmrE-like cation transporter